MIIIIFNMNYQGNKNAFVTLSAAEIKGYTLIDVLTYFPVTKGRLDFGVYNLWGNQYKTVFAQQAAVTNANSLLAIPAEGRTFAVSYTVNY